MTALDTAYANANAAAVAAEAAGATVTTDEATLATALAAVQAAQTALASATVANLASADTALNKAIGVLKADQAKTATDTAALSAALVTLKTEMAALSAAITASEQPALPESANLTAVPPATSIVDAQGATWTLTGGQIAKNGVVDPITGNVTLLVYVNHVLWQNAVGLWWPWNSATNTWGASVTADPRPTVPTPPPPPPVSGTRSWALFDSPGNDVGMWAALNSGWAAQPIDGLHVYTDVGAGAWAGSEFNWVPKPLRILLTFEWGKPGSGSWPGSNDLSAAARGDYDAMWLTWLQAAAADTPAPIVAVRIFQEINANWMQWSDNEGGTAVDGTPSGQPWSKATVIAAWRRAATLVRQVFPKAVIEWNLSAGGPLFSSPPSHGPGDGSGYDLYPGDDLVDIVGIDSYEEGQDFPTFKSGGAVNLDNLAAFAAAHNKLVAISETATSNCDSSYLKSLLDWMDAQGARSAYLAYYEANNTAQSNVLGSTSGQPGSCPANTLQQTLNASSFGTKKFGGTWIKP